MGEPEGDLTHAAAGHMRAVGLRLQEVRARAVGRCCVACPVNVDRCKCFVVVLILASVFQGPWDLV